MSPHPIRLLVSGYGLAAIAAGAVAVMGGPLWTAGLVFWLGGASATLGLAGTPVLKRLFRHDRPTDDASEEAALEIALARWEADRIADSNAAAQETERRRSVS